MSSPILQYPVSPAPVVTITPIVSSEYKLLNSVVNLLGTNALTDLAAQHIAEVPQGTIYKVVIPGRGGSEWQKQPGTDVTDIDAGTIRTIDYDADTNPNVLIRITGY